MRFAWPVVGLLLALAGCADYWTKPGATKAELEAATARCDSRSFSQFPQILQTIMSSPGYLAPMRTECRMWPNGQQRCVTVGGEFVPPVFTTVDVNERARYAGFRTCMISGGWQLARDREEAEAIARSGPPAGAARAFCEDIFRRAPNKAMMAVFGNNFEKCVSTRARDLGELAR